MKTILIVEDDSAVFSAVSTVVEINNYRPIGCATAKAAEALLNDEHIDGVVLDLGLQDSGGAGFFAFLRSQPHTQRIPIVIHTSSRELSNKIGEQLDANTEIVIKDAQSYEQIADAIGRLLTK